MTTSPAPVPALREQMNIVIVGHVDHGKSTLVGRLLADTGSIDPARIEKVRRICERQGKHFEYSFLLDALEAEQEQGITIDAARCFFRSPQRDYLIIDAPGHIEFLKNMVTGAARAEAALLLIDAAEGVRENSRRHGYVLGMLGIKQVAVVVNKMDRVGYDQAVYDAIVSEYTAFLAQIGLKPARFIPVSALQGDQIVDRNATMPWYGGPTVLESIDAFAKAPPAEDQPLRMPVQDVYRFNRFGDVRRIIAGRVASGRFAVGDEVVFLPSGKRTRIASVEGFSMRETPAGAVAGQCTGVTMTEQVFVNRGDLMCRPGEQPRVSDRIRVNVFWLGREPLRRGRTYKLKLTTYSGLCEVEKVEEVLDASALTSPGARDRVERHEVARVILRLRRPLACDLSDELEETSRLVLVDGYDVAGGGIVREVLEAGAEDAALRWTTEVGAINRPLRETKQGHRAFLLALHDDLDQNGVALAQALEESLWSSSHNVFRLQLQADDLVKAGTDELHLGPSTYPLVAALLNAGQIVIATLPWNETWARTVALRLPGLDVVPCFQVRFHAGADGGDDGEADWTLDPAREPRALHDDVKHRLKTLLRS